MCYALCVIILYVTMKKKIPKNYGFGEKGSMGGRSFFCNENAYNIYIFGCCTSRERGRGGSTAAFLKA